MLMSNPMPASSVDVELFRPLFRRTAPFLVLLLLLLLLL
jgi:hypothetical protein